MKKKQITIRFNLGAILATKKLSLREAEKRTGISKNSLSVLAGEPSQVQIVTIEKLCNGLEVQPADLFVLEEK